MNHHFRRMLVIAAALTLAPSVARADLPWFGEPILPTHISLVGHASGSPDAGGTFEIVVRDLSLNPIPGSIVVVDFSNVPDLRLSRDVTGPGAIVDCPTRTVRAVTNMQGRVVFTIVGSGVAGPAQCSPSGACNGRLRIYADGVWIGELRASAFDLDGSAGVSVADLAIWLGDYGTGLDPARSDFDGSDSVGVADLSLWLARFGAGGSPESGPGVCP